MSKCFYSFQIYAFMDTLVASHPNLISKVNIGSSYENRPMYALKVESDSTDYMIVNSVLGFSSFYPLIPVQHGWCESTSDLG